VVLAFREAVGGEHYLDLLDAQRSSTNWTPRRTSSALARPDLIRAALDKVDEEGPAVLIGDTVWDVKAAKRAGVETSPS
jgi:phosphoglycolate phosphatase-like HAD superfamily hydrolase